MKRKIDLIIDLIDSRADRAIRWIENILLFLVFFLVIAWAIHLFAIATAERGISVDMQRHFNANPTYEEQQRSGANPDLDRSSLRIQVINCRTNHEIKPSA